MTSTILIFVYNINASILYYICIIYGIGYFVDRDKEGDDTEVQDLEGNADA